MKAHISRFGTKILDCIFLMRLALLAPVWTILILGWVTSNGTAHPCSWPASLKALEGGSPYLWIALASFSLIVAFIYVVNQIADIESDRINRKLFLLPHGYLSIRTAWILAIFCALAGLAGAFLFDATMVLLYAASLLLGIFYNLPPLQLKNRAWGGVLANIAGHGVLTYLVGWHASRLTDGAAAGVHAVALLSSISPGMAIAAVFLATTIPDAAGDRLTNKQTFCIRYGEKKTALASAFFCTGALFFSFFMAYNYWVMAIPSAISLALFIILATTANQKAAFQAFKWPVFLLTVFVTLFVPAYAVLIVMTFWGSRSYYKWRFGIEYPTFKMK